ncbi:MAG: RNA polymerase sigma factor [bacterium]
MTGNMTDLEKLYRQHASAVFRFAWGLCGDRSTAEDLVSETFVRILTKAPKIETRTALAYLLAVARNTFLTGRRRRRAEVPLSDQLSDRLPAPLFDPDSRLDDQARLDTVIAALRNVPEGERAALLLRVDHDLSYDDIAAALGTTPGAAKVRVHRARMRLASAMAPEGSNL